MVVITIEHFAVAAKFKCDWSAVFKHQEPYEFFVDCEWCLYSHILLEPGGKGVTVSVSWVVLNSCAYLRSGTGY